jgi:hypothetical protein
MDYQKHLFIGGVLLAARADNALRRSLRLHEALLGGFLSQTLTADDMTAMTIALYGVALHKGPSRLGLRAWEQAWYDASLPAPPCRILVGAAGSGREVAALRDHGYLVDSFEPVPELAAAIGARDGAITAIASYDDLVRAAAGDESSPAVTVVRRRYDAVILGWNSFTNILPLDGQRNLLRACDSICPEGPVLASFWPPAGALRSRGWAVGSAIGQLVRRARNRPSDGMTAGEPEGLGFAFNVGFTRRFGRAEMDSLADEAGRQVAVYGQDPYGHATLVPRDGA